jgi:hypothetical protein
MQKLCCICKKTVDSETAPILAIGGFGNAKYLCEECSGDIDTASSAREYDNISAALDKLGEKLNVNNVDDELVINTVDVLFTAAKERAEKIKAGTYDFSEDEKEDPEQNTDIAEELLETEEDKRLDMEEEKRNKKADKIYNWAFLVILLGALIYFILDRFVFN